MQSTELQHKVAAVDDIEHILSMMEPFYEEDKIEYVEARVRRGLSMLLSDQRYGAVLLFEDDAKEPAGYAIVTIGFSVEYGGRYALLDELYLLPQARGRGWGKNALGSVKDWAVGAGVEAIRLEVHHHNEKAKSLYLKIGFKDDHRDILTRLL